MGAGESMKGQMGGDVDLTYSAGVRSGPAAFAEAGVKPADIKYASIYDSFTITVEDIEGTQEICSTTFKGLPHDVNVGDLLLIDDGKVTLRATAVDDVKVTTEVVVGGMVSNNKGINLPGVAVSVPALSKKDEDDLRWALRAGFDVVALSFVRSGRDILDVHRIMDEEGRRLPVIAKVEKPQAVENIEDIVAAFDGIMVARGDLGVEMPLEKVPGIQKRIVRAARRLGKPVVVATQMLESMITSPVPTRRGAWASRRPTPPISSRSQCRPRSATAPAWTASARITRRPTAPACATTSRSTISRPRISPPWTTCAAAARARS